MRRYLRATLGALALVTTAAAGSLAIGAVAPSLAGATVAMGTTSGGEVTPVAGTPHTHPRATDFPDPDVTYSGSGNTYYAYGTGTSFLVTADWTTGGIGFTKLSCTTSGCSDQSNRTVAKTKTAVPRSLNVGYGLQAPSVVYLNGQWVMYYGGYYATANTGAYAIYYSTSSSPTSNFTNSLTEAPLIAQTSYGGSTDPSAFIAPTGLPWLTWKTSTYRGDNDKAHLWSMRLTTDGTAMKSGASSYILATQPTGGWAGTTIENPQMVWSGGTYYLFYSGGLWTTATYAEGYTTCSGPTGGCGTPNTHRILSKYTTGVYGPGGGSLFTTTTGTWLMAFHSWSSSCTRYATSCNAYRDLYVRPVSGLYSTSLPSISSFTASSYTFGATGGSRTVTLTAHATRAVSYTFSVSPGIGGLPSTIHTTTGSAAATVRVPTNLTHSAVHYVVTVVATGPYGGQVSWQLTLTVTADTYLSRTAVGVEGPSNSLYEYWNNDNTPGWNSVEVAGPGSAYSNPTLVRAVHDSRAVMVVEGPAASLYEYWNNDGSPTWNAVEIAGPGSAFTAPAVVRAANTTRTVVEVEGSGGSLYEYWNNDNTPTWNAVEIAGPGTTYAAPAVVRAASTTRTVVEVEGPSYSLYEYWNNDGSPTWNAVEIAGARTDFTAPAVVRAASTTRTVVEVEGPSATLYEYWNNDGSPTWNAVEVAGTGSMASAAAVVRAASTTRTVIEVEGPSATLYEYWNNDGSPTWNAVEIAGPGSTYSTPSVVRAASTTRTAIEVEGPSDSLYEYWNNDGSPTWNAVEAAGTGSTYARPSVVRA